MKSWHFGILAVVTACIAASPGAVRAQWILDIEPDNAEVEVRPHDKPDWEGVWVGRYLELGDLLRPSAEASVWVRCGNGTTPRVPSGRPSGLRAICPQSNRSGDPRPDYDIFLLLLTERFPYGTVVAEVQPLLRWPSVMAATGYRVRVMAGERELWQTQTSAPEVRYEGEPLEAGADYRLEVEAVGTAAQPYSLAVRVLEAAEAAQLQAQRADIQGQALSEAAKARLLADEYWRYGGLAWEVMATLEPWVAAGSETVVMHRWLADAYLQVGWHEAARERYAVALDLAAARRNAVEEVEAMSGLAHVAAATGQLDEVQEWLQRAREGYAALGDAENLDLVEQWSHKLELYREGR